MKKTEAPSFVKDQFYQFLLRQCTDREKQAATISNMKINQGGGMHFAALEDYITEIRLLKQIRHAYIEYFVDQHPGAKTRVEVEREAFKAVLAGLTKKPKKARQSKQKRGV